MSEHVVCDSCGIRQKPADIKAGEAANECPYCEKSPYNPIHK